MVSAQDGLMACRAVPRIVTARAGRAPRQVLVLRDRRWHRWARETELAAEFLP